MTAYEECLSATSTADFPGMLLPDRLSLKFLDILEGLDMHDPKGDPERQQELLSTRNQLIT